MVLVAATHDGDLAGLLAATVLALLAPLPRDARALEREDGEAVGAVGITSLVVDRGGSIQQLLGRIGEARGQRRSPAGSRVYSSGERGRRGGHGGRGRGRRLRQVVERVEQPRRGGAELGVRGGRWT